MKYLLLLLLYLTLINSVFAGQDCIETTDHLRASLYLDGFQSIKPEPTENGVLVLAESDHEIIHPNAYISNPGYYTRTYSYVVDSDTGETCNFSSLTVTFKRHEPKTLTHEECLELQAKYKSQERKKYRLWHPFRIQKPTPKDDATLYGRACELAFTSPQPDDYYQD